MHILSNEYIIYIEYDVNKLFYVFSILTYPIVDLSRIVIKSLEITVQRSEIINVSDGTAIKTTEYYEKVYDALGVNLPQYISYEEAKKTYDKKRLSFLNESRVLDTAKMKKMFPGCIKYTKLSDGIKASLYPEPSY